jgi:Protein of unknown function (DUF5818)
MKRFLSIVALLAVPGLGVSLSAQQTPSTKPSTPGQASSTPQQQPTNSQQSARSFEGKITKSGDSWVLQDTASGASYKLDDQDKAKQFNGKNVKVMATMDASTNTLHVVDITSAER